MRAIATTVAAVLLAGCPDATSPTAPDVTDDVAGDASSDTTGPGSDAPVPDAGAWSYGTPCENGTLVGKFEVAHWDFYASIAGEVANGIVPLTVLQPAAEVGDCALMQKVNPFCDPPCAGGELCDHNGSCLTYPENLDVGTVSVFGLMVDAQMTPNVTMGYAKTDLPFPMWVPGRVVGLSASGGDVPAFELRAWTVPDLELPEEVSALEPGSDFEVTWTPSDGPGRIYMTLNIDQHGNSPVTLICDVEDTGSYIIPAQLVDQLLGFGVSGFATFQVTRRTVDSTTLTPGCVELRVFSYRLGKVVVEGHTPCNVDPDCTPPQTCDVPINTCVDP